MGLKPLAHPHLTKPFTEVRGNRINSKVVLLPSALADDFYILLLMWALAAFLILLPKRLIQKKYLV